MVPDIGRGEDEATSRRNAAAGDPVERDKSTVKHNKHAGRGPARRPVPGPAPARTGSAAAAKEHTHVTNGGSASVGVIALEIYKTRPDSTALEGLLLLPEEEVP
jgi:hypothetical protein